jgi:FtsZ-binding cell division protein ZapB
MFSFVFSCFFFIIFDQSWHSLDAFLSVRQKSHIKCSSITKISCSSQLEPAGNNDSFPPSFDIHKIFNQKGKESVLISRIDLKFLTEEREKLLSERATLLTQLATLTNESLHYLNTIKLKDVEIEELRHENAKLRERISSLESQVSALQREVSALKGEVSALQAGNEYRNFVMALQDINFLHQLENYPAISRSMRRLRKSRVESSNYILKDEDTPELVDYKISVLTAKMQSDMTAACRQKFQNSFGVNFVQEVLHILAAISINSSVKAISDSDKEEAFLWWA